MITIIKFEQSNIKRVVCPVCGVEKIIHNAVEEISCNMCKTKYPNNLRFLRTSSYFKVLYHKDVMRGMKQKCLIT